MKKTSRDGSIYLKVQLLPPDQFKRKTGVRKATFKKMVDILRPQYAIAKRLGGPPSKLCLEDKLLLMLTYYREYGTIFAIAANLGVSEATAHRTIRWVESVLIKSGAFGLPGKKVLASASTKFEVILIDASEHRIERPKKNNVSAILVKRSATPSRVRL